MYILTWQGKVQHFTLFILVELTTIPFALSIVEGLRTVSGGYQGIWGNGSKVTGILLPR
jgi:hypothetical protein